MLLRKVLILTCTALFVLSLPSGAELSRADRKLAQKKLSAGKLYLRIDAPCTQGRHPYGVYMSPVVDVSPAGVNTEAESGVSFGWYHASSTVWAVRVNDPVQYDDISWEDDGTAEIEVEGVDTADGRDTVLRFVGIQTLADFNAAFERAFSARPLQDEHSDWPEDVRKSIGERHLLPGMTKRQAYYVVGLPAQVEKSTADGKEIEIWTLRKKGAEIGFFTYDPGDFGAPSEKIRFEDGKLILASVKTDKLDLGD